MQVTVQLIETKGTVGEMRRSIKKQLPNGGPCFIKHYFEEGCTPCFFLGYRGEFLTTHVIGQDLINLLEEQGDEREKEFFTSG